MERADVLQLREEELKKKAEEEARAAAAAETTTRLSGGGCARAEAAPGTQEAPPVTTAQQVLPRPSPGSASSGAPRLTPPQEMLEKLRRARMKMDKKLAKMAKRMEHLERARREAEKPYLEVTLPTYLFSRRMSNQRRYQAAIEAWQKEDKANYEKNVEAMLKQHQQAWQVCIVPLFLSLPSYSLAARSLSPLVWALTLADGHRGEEAPRSYEGAARRVREEAHRAPRRRVPEEEG
jgi:hypothetical protein